MAFDIHTNGDHAKLVLSGDVDLQTTADLKNDIVKLHGITHFEIDAGDVSYIDSSGVAVLLLARQHCQQNNIRLALPVISVAVKRVLEVARLDQLLPIAEVVEMADSGVMGLGAEATALPDDEIVSALMSSDEDDISSPSPNMDAAWDGAGAGGDPLEAGLTDADFTMAADHPDSEGDIAHDLMQEGESAPAGGEAENEPDIISDILPGNLGPGSFS
jgi:anti-sigma B factor antagonist